MQVCQLLVCLPLATHAVVDKALVSSTLLVSSKVRIGLSEPRHELERLLDLWRALRKLPLEFVSKGEAGVAIFAVSAVLVHLRNVVAYALARRDEPRQVHDEPGRHLNEILASESTSARDKTAATKEQSKLAKQLTELADWERDVIYPLATQRLEIDLDDGVKANYPKFGKALAKIPGIS